MYNKFPSKCSFISDWTYRFLHDKRRFLSVFLFVLTVLMLSALPSHAEKSQPMQPAAFSCTQISDVPQSECQALVEFYTRTNGANWLNKTNWLSEQQTQLCGVWHGIYCDNGHVTTLHLSQNRLTGALPAKLRDLTQLQRLWLDQNQLSGTIPVEIGTIASLQEITLWGNQLTGEIPSVLGDLSNLTWLDLSRNQLSGTIPVALARLNNLRTLGAQENQLSGTLPTQLGTMTKLENLWLSNNQLSGSIPVELGNLAQLKDLGLSSNQLTGIIPTSLGNLQQLTRLWLGGNQLNGTIPTQLGQLANLQDLLLSSNQLTGNIPPSLGNLRNLSESLGLNNNQLSGAIPAELGNLTNLKRLSLRDNQLSGELPSALGNLRQLLLLYLYNNPNLTGALPASLANLTQMNDFQFQNTALCEPAVTAIQTWLAAITTLQKSGINCFDPPITPQPTGSTPIPTATSTTPTPTATQTPTATPTDDGCDKFDQYEIIPKVDANLKVTVNGATVEIKLDWKSSTEAQHLFGILHTYLFSEGEVEIPAGDYDFNNPTTLRITDLPDATYHVVVIYDEIIGLAQQNQRRTANWLALQQTPTPATNRLLLQGTALQASVPITETPPFSGSYHFTKPDCFEAGQQTGHPASFWDAFQFTVGAKPIINGIKAKHPLTDHRYLQGIPVNNEITLDVDWQGRTPGTFELHEKESGTLLGSAVAGEKIIVNMGALPKDGYNTLQAIAYTAKNKIASEPFEERVFSMPMPVWLTGLVGGGMMTLPIFGSGDTTVSGGSEYKMDFSIPVEGLKLKIDTFAVPEGKVGWNWQIKGNGSISLDCFKAFSADVTGKVKKEFFLAKVEANVYGKVAVAQVEPPCQVGPPTFEVGADVQYSRNIYRKPLPVLVIYINPAFGRAIDVSIRTFRIDGYLAKIGEVYIDGKLNVGGKSNVLISKEPNYLQFQDLIIKGGIGIQGGVRADVGIAEAELWLGGNGTISFARPGAVTPDLLTGLAFDNITLLGEAGAKFRVATIVREYKGEIKWVYPPTSDPLLRLNPLDNTFDTSFNAVQDSGWRFIPHQTAPQSVVFMVEPSAAQAFARHVQAAGNSGAIQHDAPLSQMQNSLLLRNVYTYPETALALSPTGDQGMLLWVQPDAAKKVGQAHELSFSRWNGAAWSNPAPVTNDLLLDSAPQLKWGNDGNVVAIWQRFKETLTETSAITDSLFQQSEIATALFNPSSGRWSPIALLSDNNALDMTPTLASNRDGKLLAAWRQNADGWLMGDATHPDQIMVAFYDKGWGSSTVAVKALAGLNDLTAGYGNNSAVLVYSQAITPSNNLTATLELFSSAWNGSAWSVPTQLTSNSVFDQHSPQLLHNQANQPMLLWLSGKQLQLRNLATGQASPPLRLPDSISGVSQFSPVQDQAGNIAAVFTAQNYPYGLYLVFFDQAHNLWSNPTRLSETANIDTGLKAGIEKDLSAVMGPDGRLLMGYALSQIGYLTKTLEVPPNERISYAIPVEQRTDLMTLSRSFVRNLTLAEADLRVSTLEQRAFLTATIHNSGDFAIDNVKVRFYVKQEDGTLLPIGEQTDNTPLAGHSTLTVTLAYTLPANTRPNFAAKVDPDNLIVESNETDNAAGTRLSTLYLPIATR